MEEVLYMQLYPQLLRYCIGLTGQEATAQDLTQEACLRLLMQEQTMAEASLGQCRSWLYKTARNLWIDRLRQAARETSNDGAALEQTPFWQDLTRIEVEQLLSRLSGQDAALFRLRYFEGISSRQLGEWFDLPPGTVRARLSEARKKLRRWMSV